MLRVPLILIATVLWQTVALPMGASACPASSTPAHNCGCGCGDGCKGCCGDPTAPAPESTSTSSCRICACSTQAVASIKTNHSAERFRLIVDFTVITDVLMAGVEVIPASAWATAHSPPDHLHHLNTLILLI